MQWAFYRIPTTGGEPANELNRFMRSVRVLNVYREFVAQGEASHWAMAVEYLAQAGESPQNNQEGKSLKVDYKSVLSSEDFALFARLREWRKQVAATEAIPVYTIFTNEQLAEMARRRCSTLAALGAIEGIGQGRLEKYGRAALDTMARVADGAG